jgi:hypothetical protein
MQTPISDKQYTYPCPDAKIVDVRWTTVSVTLNQDSFEFKRPNPHDGI